MKIWFIINRDRHSGPYNLEELKELNLAPSSLVWKKGLEAPVPYSTITGDLPPPIPREEPKLQNIIEPVPIQKEKLKNSYVWAISFVSFFIFCIGLFYLLGRKELKRPEGLAIKEFTEATELLDKKQESIKISKDRKKIYFFSPRKKQENVTLHFKSIDKKILLSEPVEFTTKCNLSKNHCTFDSFYYEQGNSIVDGYYFMSDGENKKVIKLSTFDDDKLDSLLAKFNKALEKRENEFFNKLKQEYDTLYAITEQIELSLNKVINGNQSVSNFENEYKKNFGIYFTSFVLENEKETKRLSTLEFNDKVSVLSHYETLSHLAKSIGSVSMEILDSLQKGNQELAPLYELKNKIKEEKEKLNL